MPLLATVALLAACGEDEIVTGNIVSPKDRYIRQADALCTDFKDAVLGTQAAAREASPRERARLVRRLRGRAKALDEKLEAIPRPDADRELLDRFLAEFEIGRVTPKAKRLADRYGFDSCGV